VIDWAKYPNFSPEGDPMLACPCCGDINISPSLMDTLQDVRNITLRPMTITSGVRCEKHNKAVGGVSGSAHVPFDLNDGEGEVGHAIDVAISGSKQRYEILGPLLIVGGERIGIGKTFIHMDNDTRKPEQVIFTYYASDHVA